MSTTHRIRNVEPIVVLQEEAVSIVVVVKTSVVWTRGQVGAPSSFGCELKSVHFVPSNPARTANSTRRSKILALTPLSTLLSFVQIVVTMATEASPTIKSLAAVRVLSLRAVIPNYRAQGSLWQQLFSFAKTHDINITGPTFAINFTKDCRQTDVEVEVCLPIAGDAQVPEEAPFTIRDVPLVPRAATAVHIGLCEELPSAYQKFYSWFKTEGLDTDGPSREVYVKRPSGCDDEDQSSVTEIQQPIS